MGCICRMLPAALKSLKRVIFPAELAGEKCRIKIDVADCDIPFSFRNRIWRRPRVR